MNVVFTLRNALLGLASWAIPFVAAFAFYSRNGELAIDLIFFKSIMIVVGALVGMWLLTLAYRRVTPNFLHGVMLGLFWVVINWAFDLAVLVGAMGMNPKEWLLTIGIRYLIIPIMAGGMGIVGAR